MHVHRRNEGVSETSQGEGGIRNVEKLNDPVHSTFVMDPGPTDPQAGERSSNFSVKTEWKGGTLISLGCD